MRTPSWQRKRQRNRDYLTNLKLDLACVDCGWKPKNAAEATALEFDHVDPSRKLRTHDNRAIDRNWPWERIAAEIAKCEPRCARCHRIRTYKEGHRYLRQAARPSKIMTDQTSLFDEV